MDDVDEPGPALPRRLTGQIFRSTQRAEDVQAWAQRMRDKRAAREAEAAARSEPEATYWSADALYADSRHVAEEELLEARSAASRAECLAILGLTPTASANDVTHAFKALAKLHHPDRYVLAAPDVQKLHSDAMTRINAAYRALRSGS